MLWLTCSSRSTAAAFDTATKRKLTTQPRKARNEFGIRHPDWLRRVELDW
jgi:hypothetical protein